MFRFVRSDKGYSLPAVIVISFILMILLVAVIKISTAETTFAAKYEDKVQAHYIARSGAHSVAEYMLNDPGNASNIIGKGPSVLNTQIGGGSFIVSVEEVSNNVIITSVGEYNGVQQTVRVRVSSTAAGVGGIFNHALVAKEGIAVANASGSGIDITGSISTQSGEIDLGTHGHVSGGAIVDPTLIFPPIVQPPDRTPPFNYDQTYGTINNDLTITSNETAPTYVYASRINLGNFRTIAVSGNGVVHLFVNGDITLGTGSRFDAPAGKLYVYVIGERTVALFGRGSQNNVYIYAPDSHIKWNNAQPHNYFYGSIIGKTITLHNQLKIAYNPDMVNELDLDTGSVGVTYSGYTWID